MAESIQTPMKKKVFRRLLWTLFIVLIAFLTWFAWPRLPIITAFASKGMCSSVFLGYTLHQTTTDTATLPTHMELLRENLGQVPDALVADAGYGSEENYEYLENEGIEAYVKFNYFHKEQEKKWKENPAKLENLYYNEQQDCYYCPMGQRMELIKEAKRTTANGYQQNKKFYQAQNCQGCPMRGACHKQKVNPDYRSKSPISPL
jgi:hypothetical protein